MKNCLLLLFLFSVFCSFKNQPKPVIWAGHYKYEEEPVKGSGDVADVMIWDITVSPKGNSGTVEINGQQTFFKLLADVVVKENTITFIYNKTLDGVDFGAFKKGNVLLSFKKVNGKTVTQWATLTPRLSDKFPKECSCFVKK